MKTTRTRMLIILVVASIVISFFMHWEDVAAGYRDGRNAMHSDDRDRGGLSEGESSQRG